MCGICHAGAVYPGDSGSVESFSRMCSQFAKNPNERKNDEILAFSSFRKAVMMHQFCVQTNTKMNQKFEFYHLQKQVSVIDELHDIILSNE